MPFTIPAFFLACAFATAVISGIFGMAGGLIFMGIIASFMGVAQAMVVHGAVQSISNISRAYFTRKYIRWDICGYMALGALPAFGLLLAAAFMPSKAILFFLLGVLPGLLWVPRKWISFDAERKDHAILCGFCVAGLNLSAGVAGPALDLFFVRTGLSRQQIVATKAIAMFAAHLLKIGFFGIPLLRAGTTGLPPLWFFVAVIPCAIVGSFLGTRLLARFSDAGFRRYTRILVTLIGAIYILRAMVLMA